MRKKTMSIDEAKKHIETLSGRPLKISINKGRKKIVKYDGSIAAVYPSVFTLNILGDKNINFLSCTYSDLICGQISIKTAQNA